MLMQHLKDSVIPATLANTIGIIHTHMTVYLIKINRIQIFFDSFSRNSVYRIVDWTLNRILFSCEYSIGYSSHVNTTEPY